MWKGGMYDKGKVWHFVTRGGGIKHIEKKYDIIFGQLLMTHLNFTCRFLCFTVPCSADVLYVYCVFEVCFGYILTLLLFFISIKPNVYVMNECL